MDCTPVGDKFPWDGLLAILGVVVGYVLSELTTTFREWKAKRNAVDSIKEELLAILAQVPLKRDILQQAQAQLRQKQILRMESVGFPARAFQAHWEKAHTKLTLLERDNLQVIYESIARIDKFMENFSEEITSHLERQIMNEPFEVYGRYVSNLLDVTVRVEDLCKKYLAGTPMDVFFRNGVPSQDVTPPAGFAK